MKTSKKKKKNPVVTFFKKLYKIVDTVIVTPISTVIYKIQKKFGNDNKLEKLLGRPHVLFVLSGVLATAFAILVNVKATNFVSENAEFLTNIPVRVDYNSSAYVVEGVPKTVNITLIGKKSELYLARKLGDNEVVVDLTDYQPREKPYKVQLTYPKLIDKLRYQVSPDYVSVTIKEKTSRDKTITYDLLNQDSLDPKLSVKSVELSKSVVIVRGSQETVDSIASIKALVDLDNEDFTKEGTYVIDNLKLVAYSADGTVIDNVEIPATVSAKVVLNSYSKRVGVKVLTTGKLVTGKAISSITINGVSAKDFETTIYGDEAALEGISYLTLSIDVQGQGNNGSKTSKVAFSKPAGVRSISDESGVNVVLNFGEAKQKTIVVNGIRTINVPNGLNANLASQEDAKIEVQVIGVESVIKEIDENSGGIFAYVDLAGMTAGTHSVSVKIDSDDSRLQYIVKKDVDVVLSKSE